MDDIMPYDVSPFLEHYGKKGMRWGIRKTQKGSVRLNRKLQNKAARGVVGVTKKAYTTNKEARDKGAERIQKAYEKNKEVRGKGAERIQKGMEINAKVRDKALGVVAKHAKSKITLRRAAPNVAVTLKAGQIVTNRVRKKLAKKSIGARVNQRKENVKERWSDNKKMVLGR